MMLICFVILGFIVTILYLYTVDANIRKQHANFNTMNENLKIMDKKLDAILNKVNSK